MKNLKSLPSLLLASAVFALLTACGGGGGGNPAPQPPPVASSLVYTDPSSGAWQLKKNGALSTPQKLVLDLVAVNAGPGAGVALHLSTDGSKAMWAKVQDTDPEFVRNGSVLDLGAGVPALKGKVSGNTLQIVVARKGLAGSPNLNGVVATVALALKTNVSPGTGTLTTISGKAQMLAATGDTPAIAPALGTLQAQ